jgi:hypothetical protein
MPDEKYSIEDSQKDTGATDREQSAAWHTARDDFVKTYGDGTRESLDPSKNSSGYVGESGGKSQDEKNDVK